ncbi:MAG: nuclear transport factor 2 family protein [Microcoleaceae cyanobacterium]
MTFFRRLQSPISIIPALMPRNSTLALNCTLFSIVFSSIIGFSDIVKAQTPGNAPSELTTLLDQIETAANRQDVEAVIEYYSSDFSHSDGLDRQSLEQLLNQFWQQFSNVNYETELQSWEQEGSAIIATTITTITGNQTLNNRQFQLTATITSEQRIENQQIVQQEIIAEKNQLSTGENPPTITLNVPETVSVKQSYNVDAIVQEPLGEDIMLGAAEAQTVDASAYFSPVTLEMELLNTGGIFKIGEAPLMSEQKWISTVLMRKGGIVSITQRVRIVP